MPSGVMISTGEDPLDPAKPTSASVWRESPELNKDSVLIFLVGLAIFTFHLTPEFIGFQTRFALFAQEMFRYGPSLFPTTYDTPYPDYPATSTFLIYLVSLLLGAVTPFSAILPTAVTSALIVVVTYRIAAIRSRQWGLAAVLFALFTVEFFSQSRSISLDQYTSLATAVSFYLAYSADCYYRHKRLWLVPLIWIVGFSLRGPIGLVLPAGVLCGYYLSQARFKQFILMGVSGGIVLVFCLVGLLVAAKMQAGQSFAERVFSAQMTGRVHDGGKGYAYYWFGCLSSYALSYPLAIIVVGARFKDILRRKTDDDNLLSSLAGWILIVLIGMSIPVTKHMRYVLPIVPPLSLVAAYLLIGSSPKGILFATRKTFLAICSFLPLLGTIATVGILSFGKYLGLAANVHFPIALALLIGLSIIARTLNKRLRGYPNQDMVSAVVGVAAFIIVSIGVAQPINATLECTRPFVEKVKLLQKEQPGDLIFYQIGPDAEDIKFMVNYDKPIMPIFIKSPDELLKCQKNSYFIAKKQNFDRLPEDMKKRIQLRFGGRIGHRDCVVFTNL